MNRPPPRMSLALLVALTGCVACDAKTSGDGAAEGATAAKAPAVATGATGATGASGPTGPKVDAPDDKKPDDHKPSARKMGRGDLGLSKAQMLEAKKSQASFNKLLSEGRKLAKAKDYQGAIQKFAQADKVAPGHPAALGEHGWAAFNAGELELAEQKTRLALANVKKPKRKAAVLYNLGRIEEARENLAAARAHYEQSLSLRPNKTVEKRLAAIGAPKPEASANAGFASVDEACEFAMAQWDCGAPTEESDDDLGECDCTPKLFNAPEGSTKGIRAVGLLSVDGYAGFGGAIDGSIHLTIQNAAGRWLDMGLVGNCENPGVAYVHNDCTVKAELGDFLDAAGQELLLKITNSTYDMNPGIGEWGEYDDFGTHTWMLCRAVDGNPRCLSFAELGYTETGPLDPTLFEGEPLSKAEQAKADATLTQSASGFTVALGRDGKITLSAPTKVEIPAGDMLPNSLSDDDKVLVGTHTLEAFGRLPGVEVNDGLGG